MTEVPKEWKGTPENTDKSNNWRRLHGLCTRRKYKKHAKKN